MSGVVKGVKKVFKKVANVVKTIIKPVAIAVAAYFTAGVALSFIPATRAFAASLPGFASGGLVGTGIGAGSVAGGGIFSSAASAIGLGGGLATGATVANAGAAAAAMAGGMGVAEAASIYGAGAVEAAMTGTIAGNVAAAGGISVGSALGATGMTGAGLSGASNVAGVVAGGGNVAAMSGAGLSLTDKLLLAQTGSKVAGALFGPTPEEEYEAEAVARSKWRGAFYGMEAGDTAPAMPEIGQPAPTGSTVPQPQQQPSAPLFGNTGGGPAPPGPPGPPAPAAAPQSQGIVRPEEEQRTQPMLYGEGQMQQQIAVPEGLFAPTPGVRYV